MPLKTIIPIVSQVKNMKVRDLEIHKQGSGSDEDTDDDSSSVEQGGGGYSVWVPGELCMAFQFSWNSLHGLLESLGVSPE